MLVHNINTCNNLLSSASVNSGKVNITAIDDTLSLSLITIFCTKPELIRRKTGLEHGHKHTRTHHSNKLDFEGISRQQYAQNTNLFNSKATIKSCQKE
jgi:hypothetical protein